MQKKMQKKCKMQKKMSILQITALISQHTFSVKTANKLEHYI